MDKQQALQLLDRLIKSSERDCYGYDPIGDLAIPEDLRALRDLVAALPTVQN
jgi:hypothetical protein